MIVSALIKLVSHSGNIFEWDITLKEGKNREIKRIFSNFDARVLMIHRYSFSGLKLNNLKIGNYKKINKDQLKKMLK